MKTINDEQFNISEQVMTLDLFVNKEKITCKEEITVHEKFGNVAKYEIGIHTFNPSKDVALNYKFDSQVSDVLAICAPSGSLKPCGWTKEAERELGTRLDITDLRWLYYVDETFADKKNTFTGEVLYPNQKITIKSKGNNEIIVGDLEDGNSRIINFPEDTYATISPSQEMTIVYLSPEEVERRKQCKGNLQLSLLSMKLKKLYNNMLQRIAAIKLVKFN